jgi:hypothetical protein
MEDVGPFYDHWAYFTTIGPILWQFGIFYGYLLNFSFFGMLYQEKSCNPAAKTEFRGISDIGS